MDDVELEYLDTPSGVLLTEREKCVLVVALGLMRKVAEAQWGEPARAECSALLERVEASMRGCDDA